MTDKIAKVTKPDAEWKQLLSKEQFDVARKKGTERAFTGKYWDNHEQGLYRCICCDIELFKSEHKFESGTGWPSLTMARNPPDCVTASTRLRSSLKRNSYTIITVRH